MWDQTDIGEQVGSVAARLGTTGVQHGLRWVIVLLLACGGLALYGWSQFRGLRTPAAMEHAQVARNLAAGRGYVTRCVYPADMVLLREQGRRADPAFMPALRQCPLYPWLLSCLPGGKAGIHSGAGGQRFGPEYGAMLWLNIVLYLLCVSLTYVLGAQLFDPFVGLLACVVAAVTPAMLDAVFAGGPAMLLTALGSGAICLTFQGIRVRERGWRAWTGAGWWLAGAAVAGGMLLTEVHAWPLLLLLSALVLLRDAGRAWLQAAIFLAVALLVLSPWLWWNVRWTGSPLGIQPWLSLHDTARYAGDSFDQIVQGWPSAMMWARLTWRKLLGCMVEGLPGPAPTVVVFLAATSGFFRLHEPVPERMKWLSLSGALLFSMLMGVVSPATGSALAGLFCPVLAVFAVAALLRLGALALGTELMVLPWVAWTVAGLVLLPVLVRVMALPAPSAYPPCYPPFVGYVAARLSESEVLGTDIPWATAWYGDRVSIAIPRDPAALQELVADTAWPAALYLTQQTQQATRRPGQSRDAQGWAPLYTGMIPAALPYRHAFYLPPGTREQVFVSDETRWAAPAPDRAADPPGGTP